MVCRKITLITLLIIFLNFEPSLAPTLSKHQTENKEANKASKRRLNELLVAEFSEEVLLELLILLDAPSPDIIVKQSKLETGWYKSRLFIYENSLFGMHVAYVRDTYSDRYVIADNGAKCASYGSWQSSVLDMLLYLDYYESLGYSTVNYYKFLKDVGYCEGAQYTNILKSMT